MTSWEPQRSDYADIVAQQNPWRDLRRVPEAFAPKTLRPLANILWSSLLDPPLRRHQLILGPRRVGKTTVMYQTVQRLIDEGVSPNRLWWFRLDHPLLMDFSLGSLALAACEMVSATVADPVYIFLDELAYADKWDLWLKTFYDEQWPLRLVGTSSATATIRQRGTESGVGRWDEQFLAPYQFSEYLDLKGRHIDASCEPSLGLTIEKWIDEAIDIPPLAEQRRQFLLIGGFPELLLQSKFDDEVSEILRSQQVLRADAIEKAVYKDIPQEFSVQNPAQLERLLYTLAGQITGILSPRKIATDVGLSSVTTEKYISYLERAFLIFTLQNYSTSEETIQRRGKKVYFVDGAVRNAALSRGISPLGDSAEMGHLLENMAASHLRALAEQTRVRIYHWRQGKKAEVNLIYDHPDHPLAFEIASDRSHSTRGLSAFQKEYPRFRGRCYLVATDAIPKRPTIDAPGHLPFDWFLLAVSRQADNALVQRLGGSRNSNDG